MELDKALFVSAEVIEREIELGDETKHKLYFKEIPHNTFNLFLQHRSHEDEEIRADSTSHLIANSLCDEQGNLVLSFNKARTLKPVVANQMIDAILEINGVKKKKASE